MKTKTILVTLLALLGAAEAGAAVVDGLAAYRGEFQSGVRVWALDTPDFDPGAPSSRVSGPSDPSGRFSLDLPAGKYYLVALKKGGGTAGKIEAGDLYCFYSGNPVRVREGNPVHVGFNLVKVPDDGRASAGPTGLEGTVLFEGKPLGRCYLYVYKDASDEFRGMGFYVAPVGPDGKFRVRLPAGRYYLIGRQRQEGGMHGPLRKNDKVGYYYGNPVTVTEGKSRQTVLEAISRVEMLEEIWFAREQPTAYVLGGTVRDRGGQPLGGLYVLLYDNQETSGKPKYISGKTKPDGTFSVDVYDDGRYWLLARQNLGGPPEQGEWYGRYQDPGGRLLPVDLGAASPEARVELRLGRYAP